MQIEVFDEAETEKLLFTSDFDFLPRIGETISKDAGGYFVYYTVKEVWHAETEGGHFRTRLSVALDD